MQNAAKNLLETPCKTTLKPFRKGCTGQNDCHLRCSTNLYLAINRNQLLRENQEPQTQPGTPNGRHNDIGDIGALDLGPVTRLHPSYIFIYVQYIYSSIHLHNSSYLLHLFIVHIYILFTWVRVNVGYGSLRGDPCYGSGVLT